MGGETLLIWLLVFVGCGEEPAPSDVGHRPRVWPAARRLPRERPWVVGVQLGEKTTCLELSDSRFECFGAMRTRGADVGHPLQVTDRSVCSRDGQEERCHEEAGRVRVRRTPFVDVQVGGALCARDVVGGVWCWTSREPDDGARIIPIPVEGHATALATTGMDACVLTAQGEVRCFDPLRHVFGFGRRTRVLADHARLLEGTYLQQCWGASNGVFCSGSGRRWRVNGVDEPRLLAVGLRHGCAVDGKGVHCWGDNRHGQRALPMLDPELVMDLAAGDDHTCAVLFGGGVRCWGLDDRRQVSGPCAAGLCD